MVFFAQNIRYTLILLSVVFCYGEIFCQNDSVSNAAYNLNWLESPENFIDSVQYDDDSDLIFITKFIGFDLAMIFL